MEDPCGDSKDDPIGPSLLGVEQLFRQQFTAEVASVYQGLRRAFAEVEGYDLPEADSPSFQNLKRV